jgi:uncharacterized protein (TIGR04141 family)
MMAEKKKRLEKLTISLFREGIIRGDVLRKEKEVTGHRINSINKSEDSLFTDAVPLHPPKWANYLDPHTLDDLKAVLFSASASAVLILEASERIFAVTWGQGRHLLESDNLVQDFGLKVVLNTVAPDQLKSVDAKTIDENTVHTRRDVSRDSNFAAFGLDPIRDLLRAVTGTPQDSALAHRLTGSDALGIHTREQVPDLPSLAGRLLAAYESNAYKENFDFIDYLRPERSHSRKLELDEALVEALQSREIDDVHLAAPETLDWLDIQGFRYQTKFSSDQQDADPRVSAYLDLYDGSEISFDELKGDRLVAIRASDGGVSNEWQIYKSLVYQVELNEYLYVLSAGEWFRVDKDYRSRVEAEVEQLTKVTDLPDADLGTDEDTYNKKAAEALGALCLDKHLIYDGGPDKMEVCDILTSDGRFIHVKLRGSSSTLSHLFTQGTNTAERLLASDGDFRQKARTMIADLDPNYADVIPLDRPKNPADYEMTFAVVTRSKRKTPLTLPFFSVISLRAAAQRLGAFGLPVSIAAIPEK